MERNPLAYLRHFAHYIKKGAVRIAHTSYSEHVEVTAFKNPDHTIVAVLLNRTQEEKEVNLRIDNQIVNFVLPKESIQSAVVFK